MPGLNIGGQNEYAFPNLSVCLVGRIENSLRGRGNYITENGEGLQKLHVTKTMTTRWQHKQTKKKSTNEQHKLYKQIQLHCPCTAWGSTIIDTLRASISGQMQVAFRCIGFAFEISLH